MKTCVSKLAEDGTQGHLHAWQALYHGAVPSVQVLWFFSVLASVPFLVI